MIKTKFKLKRKLEKDKKQSARYQKIKLNNVIIELRIKYKKITNEQRKSIVLTTYICKIYLDLYKYKFLAKLIT